VKLFGCAGAWQQGLAASIVFDQTAVANPKHGADGTGSVTAPFTASEAGVAVGVCGSPMLRGAGPARPAEPAAAVLQAYLQRGAGFLEGITGAFAVAVVDGRRGETLLAVDRMGIECLAFAVTPQGVMFADSAYAVAGHAAAGARLRPQALYDYLLMHMVAAPETVFEGVHKLRAGTCVTIGAGGTRTSRYWQPEFNERRGTSLDALGIELQRCLHDAVAACEPDDRTGAFLSGGLDSSSVAGMLARVGPGPTKTFSIGFDVESHDELAYADIANRHFGCESHLVQVTADDIVEVFERIAAAFDQPFGNSSAVPTYICARTAAAQGIVHLLAGDGGDELFGGNERYLRQRVFERYRSLPSLLRRYALEPVARLIDEESAITPLRKLGSYVRQASVPLPERLESWNLVHRYGAARVLTPEFLALIDPGAPLANMRQVYATYPDTSLLNHMLFYDWQFTLSDNDLRKVGVMCELAGVRVSYPMLDSRVVDLSLRVPSTDKISATELRHFYKRAMRDFLPPEILTKSKHGFGLPFGVWLKTHARLRELIVGHLESLRSRRIVHEAFITDILARHQHGDASYYGYPLWDLAMLDAWMTAHSVTV
jgi:asparagine synthase (glutamine-hydrolysing)